ncbi:hypothetical protein [uncultured Pontibacter sp.]|uniref:hypothetical protein n=1 Tax=uncultured Pontibacter sp. TaxID=453356 RepID=UPI0026388314|nr:hypothetical protein [uncultured Pontibacter sp.]
MKNLYLLLFLFLLSCQQKELESGNEDEFNYKVVPRHFGEPLPNDPYLMALYEKNKLKNGDWYRAKVFLEKFEFPPEYSDSTIIKFFHGRASYKDIVDGKGINAVVRNDTGYVKFQAFEPDLAKGDSVQKLWEAVIINPALPDSITFTVVLDYIVYGR